AGHATATIARNGQLTLRGRLADGTALSATLKPDPEGAYRLFARPYGKRTDSALAGPLALLPHPALDLRYHVPRDASRLTWSKAPAAKDKTYPAGFSALALPVALDPWLPPAAARRATSTTPAQPAVNLAQRLGLAPDATTGAAPFGLDFLPAAGSPVTPAQLDALPAALDLSARGQPLIPKGLAAKPTLAFNASTGAVTGSFTLTDTVPAPTAKNPDATRNVVRKITLSGTLRQPPATEIDALLGVGHFLLPDLAKGPTPTSGEFQLLSP
nr:hypothetical protein [Opitutaceae bacterium]